MVILNNDLQGSSRAGYRSKRKKTNLILNSLIVIVLLLIGFVAYSIFFSGKNTTSSQKNAQAIPAKNQAVAQKQDSRSKPAAAGNNATGMSSASNETIAQNNSGDNTSNTTADNTTNNAAVSSGQGNNSSQGVQTVNIPNSNAAGTSQPAAQHTTSYDSSSADWKAMLQTISSATGINQSNMTVWFLGSDKSTQGGSVGTVSSKNNSSQKYRVYIQWDGQGYQATKVEKVSQ